MSEKLALDLDLHSASALYLMIETAIDSLNYKGGKLGQIKLMPLEQRPLGFNLKEETIDLTIELNKGILEEAGILLPEIAEIVKELDPDKPTKPIIILKPNF